MKKEIGSFYELGNIDSDVLKIELENKISELSGFENTYLMCSGREAIEAVIIDIERKVKNKSKVCILPIYTCDTVIIPFVKHGWEVYFYSIRKDLSICIQEFEKILDTVKPAVLLLHSYYGVDTLAGVRKKVNEYKREHNTFVIEDMTHSLGRLCSINCKIADYYVGSLRKWFDIPDGAFVSTNFKMKFKLKDEKEFFIKDKIKAQTLKRQYLDGNNTIEKNVFLTLNKKAENYLYENDSICEMSFFSRERMQHICIEKILEKRKENSIYLEKELSAMHAIKCVLEMDDASPIYFPIYVENREKLQEWLKVNDIFAPVLWSIPEEVKEKLDEDGTYIFEHLLALPCDQRYSIEDMKRIVTCIQEYERKEVCE